MKRYAKMISAFLMSLAIVRPAGAQEMVQVKGSDTMVNLAHKMAEVYMQKNPGRFVSVTGGGSGTGIAGTINKTVDVANSSRDIKENEIANARKVGVDPVRTVIGMDCITVVVNGANGVDKLTVSQLGAIFRGEITN